jgi:hypothetical protein
MKVQQYRIESKGEGDYFAHARVGQMVHAGDGTQMIVGFVSRTNELTYIEITLFDPVFRKMLPENIIPLEEKVDWHEVFDRVALEMSDTMKQKWAEAAAQIPTLH